VWLAATFLLHFDALLVQALHGVHLAGVGLAAAVDFAESAPADDPVHGEVVHGQVEVQLKVFPLTKAGKLVALDKLLKNVAPQVREYLLDIRLK